MLVFDIFKLANNSMKLIKERDGEAEKGSILGRMEKWSEKGSRERGKRKKLCISRATLDEKFPYIFTRGLN